MSPRARNIIIAVVAAVLLVTVVGPVRLHQLHQGRPARAADPRRRHHHDRRRRRTTSTTGATAEGIEGTWTVADGSIVGYRIDETLFGQDSEAVGRSEGVTGEVTIEGTTVTDGHASRWTWPPSRAASPSATTSSENRIMEVAEFPTATFVLTEPIELGAVPADGEEVTATATGDLTLHGVTREVTIDLVARLDGTTFAVDGTHHRHVLRLRHRRPERRPGLGRRRGRARGAPRLQPVAVAQRRSAAAARAAAASTWNTAWPWSGLRHEQSGPPVRLERVQRDRRDGEHGRHRPDGRRVAPPVRPRRPTAAARATSPPSCSVLAQRPPGPWYATLPEPLDGGRRRDRRPRRLPPPPGRSRDRHARRRRTPGC